MKGFLVLLFCTTFSFAANAQFSDNRFSTGIYLDESHVLQVELIKNKFEISTQERIVDLKKKHRFLSVYVVELTDSTQWMTGDVSNGKPFAQRYYPLRGTMVLKLRPFHFLSIRPSVGIMDTTLHLELQASICAATFKNERTRKEISITDTTVFRLPQRAFDDPKDLEGVERYHEIENVSLISYPEIYPENYDEVSALIKECFVSEDYPDMSRIYVNVLIDRAGIPTVSYLHRPKSPNIQEDIEEIIQKHLRYPVRGESDEPEEFSEVLVFYLN